MAAGGGFNLGALYQTLRLDITNFIEGMKSAIAAADSLQQKLNALHLQPGNIKEDIKTAFDMSEPLEDMKTVVGEALPEAAKAGAQKTRKVVDDLGKLWEDDAKSRIKLAKEADKEILSQMNTLSKSIEDDEKAKAKLAKDADKDILKSIGDRAKAEEKQSDDIIKLKKQEDIARLKSIEDQTKQADQLAAKNAQSFEAFENLKRKSRQTTTKEDDKLSADNAKLFEMYENIKIKARQAADDDFEEAMNHRKTVERKTALEADKTWRGSFGRMKQGLREFLGDATKNFSGISDTANASFAQIIGGLVKMSLGFFIAMQATQIFQMAIQGLFSLVKSAITAFAQLETQTINVARSLIIAGQVGAEKFRSILPAAKAITLELRRIGAEAGVDQDEFALMTQRLVQLGFSWKNAAKFAQTAAMTFKLNFGQYGQFFIVQQELTDLVTGNLEKSATMIRLIGAKAVEEVRALVMSNEPEKALEKLNKALGNTAEQFKTIRNQIDSLNQQVGESFKTAAGGTEAGTAIGVAWREVLSAVNDDLREGGILWLGIQGIVLLIAAIVGLVALGLRAINAVVISMVLPFRALFTWLDKMSDSLNEQNSLWTKISKNVVFDKLKDAYNWVIKIKNELLEIVYTTPDLDAALDSTAAIRAKARGELEELRGKQDALTKIEDARLKTVKDEIGFDKARVQFGAEAESIAKSELSAVIKRVDKEKQELMMKRDRSIEELRLSGLADDELEKKRNAIQADIDATTEAMKQLDIETQIAGIKEREATLTARLQRINTMTANAQALDRSHAELEVARLIEMQSSEQDRIAKEHQARRGQLSLERKGIVEQIDEMVKMFGLQVAIQKSEFQTLMQRRDSITELLETDRIMERIKLKNVDITDEIAKQRSLIEMDDIRFEGLKSTAGVDLEMAKLGISQKLMTSLEEQKATQLEQIKNSKTMIDIENKSIGLAVRKALLDYQEKILADTTGNLKERAIKTLNEELLKLGVRAELNEKNLALLIMQENVMHNMERTELTKNLAQGLKLAVSGFLDGLREGEVKIKDFLKGLTESFFRRFMGDNLEKMINKLVTGLEKGIESIAKKLANAFGGKSEFWGTVIHGIITVALTAFSALFNQQKAEVESLADEAKGTIEDVERTRGLIAGEQSIRIAQMSESLERAFRPTNDILMRIERILSNGSWQGSATYGSQPPAATSHGYSITTEILSASR